MPKKKIETKPGPNQRGYGTKAEEWEALEKTSERMKNDHAYALGVAKRAGFLNEKGELADYFKRKVENPIK